MTPTLLLSPHRRLGANIFHKINLRNSKFPPIVFKIYLLLIYQNFSLNFSTNINIIFKLTCIIGIFVI